MVREKAPNYQCTNISDRKAFTMSKNKNTADTHKEVADKAEQILKGKKRSGVFRCPGCGTYYNPTFGKCPTCGQ